MKKEEKKKDKYKYNTCIMNKLSKIFARNN